MDEKLLPFNPQFVEDAHLFKALVSSDNNRILEKIESLETHKMKC